MFAGLTFFWTMRRLLLFVVLAGFSVGASSQSRVECRPVPYKNVICLHVEHSPQGLAVYGRYAFMLRHGGQLVPIDIKEGLVCFGCHLPNNTTHCNNASWGTRRRGKLPLLYVSDCYGEKYCRVYDIKVIRLRHTSEFGAEEVQRIVFETQQSSYAMDWCVDAANHHLYAYGGQRGGELWLKEFSLPNSSDTLVRLTDSDVLRTITVRGVDIPQGSMVCKGRIYLLDGDEPGTLWLRVYDLKSGQELGVLDLNNVGLEPEGISANGRWVYVSFNGGVQGDKIIKYKLPRK